VWPPKRLCGQRARELGLIAGVRDGFGFLSAAFTFGVLSQEATLAPSFPFACLIDGVAGGGVQSFCVESGVIELVDDAQYFASEIADQDVVSPTKIAVVGGSYGGGMSMALAALKDRVMLPSGRLVPWRSPDGKRMSLAAATPFIPWTDLAYALVPNGSTLDYVANAPYRGRYGVMKNSYVNALYAVGCGTATTFCATSGIGKGQFSAPM